MCFHLERWWLKMPCEYEGRGLISMLDTGLWQPLRIVLDHSFPNLPQKAAVTQTVEMTTGASSWHRYFWCSGCGAPAKGEESIPSSAESLSSRTVLSPQEQTEWGITFLSPVVGRGPKAPKKPLTTRRKSRNKKINSIPDYEKKKSL